MSLASSLLEAPAFPECFEPGSSEERTYTTALVAALKDQIVAYKETCASTVVGNRLLVSSVLASGKEHERCQVAELSALIDAGTVNNKELMEKLTVRHLLDPGLTMNEYGSQTQEALRRNIREHHLLVREMLMAGDVSGGVGPALTTKTIVRTVTTTTTVSRMTGDAESAEGKMKVEYVREREVRYVKE